MRGQEYLRSFRLLLSPPSFWERVLGLLRFHFRQIASPSFRAEVENLPEKMTVCCFCFSLFPFPFFESGQENKIPRFLSAAGLLALNFLVATNSETIVASEMTRLWPKQKMPAGLVTISSRGFTQHPDDERPISGGDDHMLAQSLSGLAAQAVNQGQGDELLFIDPWNNSSYHQWRRFLLDRTGIEDRGQATVWELVARYQQNKIIKGYILYRLPIGTDDDQDQSANVATSLSGILRGVMVSERQEATAKQLGLPLLLDARGKTEAWCFENYQDRFDRSRLLLQRPRVPNNRAIAIAHSTLTISGDHDLAEQVYQWLDAPGLIFGWNGQQEEGKGVQQLSAWGHLLCPSDWAMNLPALSVGASDMRWPQFTKATSLAADAKKKSIEQPLAFVLTDGDNLQWILGDFAWNKSFWASPQLERLPFGFGLPIADLMEVAPDAYLFFQKTKPQYTSIIVSPEYVFVDHFGTKLSPRRRERLLGWYARRIESVLQRSGLNSIVLICDRLDHQRSQEAWAILAAGAPSLSAAFVIQYHPYEAGHGKIWRIERPKDASVPFVSASYSLWARANRPRAGGPAKLAAILNARLENHEVENPREPTDASNSSWITVHAWSEYQESVTNEETVDGTVSTYSGVDAAARCAKRLRRGTNLVAPEQLISHPLAGRGSPDEAKADRSTSAQGNNPQ